ncbi:pirin family protein [Cyanobium sp. ATX 6A2]|nr:pirin family protein [Cyanobium sp. ATX 6A2]
MQFLQHGDQLQALAREGVFHSGRHLRMNRFAGHHHPQWTGFGWHPHRHMELITVMVEGDLTHRDSLGHTHTLSAGEVQVLSAGSGIIHSEMNAGHRPCRFLQIWIEPDSRDGLPAYDQRRYAIGSTWIPLIDPAQADAAMSLHVPGVNYVGGSGWARSASCRMRC